mgnify:FL=1
MKPPIDPASQPHSRLLLNMSILITGGGSQIGLAAAQALKATHPSVPIIFATRSGSRIPSASKTVTVDFADPSTFDNAFNPDVGPIRSVYLLTPHGPDPSGGLITFVNKAIENGTRRFVLLSGSILVKESMHPGAKIWRHFEEEDVEYVILKPTSFIGKCQPDQLPEEDTQWFAADNI